jgi:CheY-like chemotaxis protein
MTELAGLKALVVEDEAAVALLLEDMLLDLGCEIVASAANLAAACRCAAEAACDFALLDVNLGGQQVFAAAEILERRGIPFVFSTGYGVAGLPDAFRNRPTLTKPFMIEDLERQIRVSMGAR